MKKRLLRMFAVLSVAVFIAALFAAPAIYFKISDKMLFDKSFATEDLPKIEIGGSEIEFLNGAKAYLYGAESEMGSEECSAAEVLPHIAEFVSQMPFSSAVGAAVNCSVNDGTYIEAFGTEAATTYCCFNKDYETPVQELIAVVENKTGKLIAFSLRFGSESMSADAAEMRMEILEKYLEYSTLDVLNDWKYNGARFYSEKAGLFLNAEINANENIIYIGLER